MNSKDPFTTAQFSEDDFRSFVQRFSWTFAKTYAETAPHEYVALNKVGVHNKDDFIKAAQFIRDNGYRAMYYTRDGFYYSLDEHYYWTMNENAADTNLVNRAKLSDYELVNNSWVRRRKAD